MPPDPRKWNRRDALAFGPILLIPIALIILNCSGLLFPVIGKQSSLINGMSHDLHITAPASLHVEHAARLAMRDPAYFYACSIDPIDIPPLVAALTSAPGYDANMSDSDKRFSMESTPAWYNPGGASDLQRLKFEISSTEASVTGYWFFFSPSAHKLWVYWFST